MLNQACRQLSPHLPLSSQSLSLSKKHLRQGQAHKHQSADMKPCGLKKGRGMVINTVRITPGGVLGSTAERLSFSRVLLTSTLLSSEPGSSVPQAGEPASLVFKRKRRQEDAAALAWGVPSPGC